MMPKAFILVLLLTVHPRIVAHGKGLGPASGPTGDSRGRVEIIGINYAAWYPRGWWTDAGPKGYGHVWRVREGVSAPDRPGGRNPRANPVKPLFEPHTEYGGWNKAAIRWDIEQARRAGLTCFAMPISRGFRPEYEGMGDAILAEGFRFLIMADQGLTDEELLRYLRRWWRHPRYVRMDRRPVIWVYGGSWLRDRHRIERELGSRLYAIGAHASFPVDVCSEYAWIMDIFDPAQMAEPRYRELARSGRTFAPIMTAMFTAGGRSASWDARRWRACWEIATRHRQNNPALDIYSVVWNEIFETSLIVPTREYGDEPLRVTREMLERHGLIEGKRPRSVPRASSPAAGPGGNIARHGSVTTTGDPQHGWPLSWAVDGAEGTQVDVSFDENEELKVTLVRSRQLGRIVVREGAGGDRGHRYVVEVRHGDWEEKGRFRYGGADAVREVVLEGTRVSAIRIRSIDPTPGVEIYIREIEAFGPGRA